MDMELANLAKYNVFKLVPRPDTFRPVPSKWVYKLKVHPDGTIDKFRARLVAKGFRQRKGIDYDETFSPVISHTALRIVLTMAMRNNWPIESYDVITTYLNSPMDRPIYMHQIEGYINAEHPDWVLLLNRALYGVKQAARVWNQEQDIQLKALGFQPIEGEPCVYLLRSKSSISMILCV